MEAMLSLACGRNIIAVFFFNAANGSNCSELHAELCDAHYEFDRSMYVSPSEITQIINDLPCNKSPGLDGLTSEHLKYASSQLSMLLSILMSAILTHGRVPSAMLKSVMIPIVKNKNKYLRQGKLQTHIFR